MKIRLFIICLFSFALFGTSCAQKNKAGDNKARENKTKEDKYQENKLTQNKSKTSKPLNMQSLDTATFGGGCFWCTEAIFLEIKGVEKVVSGYSGGKLKNPTYKEVCSGLTGHAEVIQIYFDSKLVDFKTLLGVFLKTHDPTTLNKQGNDVGTQYRSVVFYHDDEQKKITEEVIQKLNTEQAYPKPIITEVSPATVFYAAEDYHQNYFNQNGNQPYCSYVIQPKVDKFKKVFPELMK